MHMILPGWRPKHKIKHEIPSCGASNRNGPHKQNPTGGRGKRGKTKGREVRKPSRQKEYRTPRYQTRPDQTDTSSPVGLALIYLKYKGDTRCKMGRKSSELGLTT